MSLADRARRRITKRILPYLFLLYVIAYLDRVNVGYAALEMTNALRFGPEVYGFGAGIFFFGYFLLEIPGSILVERWSARKWIARIMISWGAIAIAAGFIHTATQFYWVRFLLGAAEAGFFPGIVVYLTHWFRYEDRAKAMAAFMAAQSISNIIGSPISGLLLGIHWLGIEGWRWLFILEGAPAVLFGIVTMFNITDWPHQAKWLPEDERGWIASELEREREAKLALHSYTAFQALRQPPVVRLWVGYFFMVANVYGFNFWMPTMLKRLSGLSNLLVTSIGALPYCVGLAAVLLVGWSSDRKQERRVHTAICMTAAGAGLLFSAATQNSTLLTVSMFCLAAAGMYGYLPAFWALPTSFLSGTAAAASIGFINSVGNLGGFVGPAVVGYLTKTTHNFLAGVIYLSCSAFLGAGLILSVRIKRKPQPLSQEASA